MIDLCDGVLVEEKDNLNNWFIIDIDDFDPNFLDRIMIKCWNYNAFIKTDKGLIYVAKLNEKGEWVAV